MPGRKQLRIFGLPHHLPEKSFDRVMLDEAIPILSVSDVIPRRILLPKPTTSETACWSPVARTAAIRCGFHAKPATPDRATILSAHRDHSLSGFVQLNTQRNSPQIGTESADTFIELLVCSLQTLPTRLQQTI